MQQTTDKADVWQAVATSLLPCQLCHVSADLLQPLNSELQYPPRDLLSCMAALQLVHEVAQQSLAASGALLAQAVLAPILSMCQSSDDLLACPAFPVMVTMASAAALHACIRIRLKLITPLLCYTAILVPCIAIRSVHVMQSRA